MQKGPAPLGRLICKGKLADDGVAMLVILQVKHLKLHPMGDRF